MSARNILVINCGSSSIKFALINEAQPHFTLSGLAERLVRRKPSCTGKMPKASAAN